MGRNELRVLTVQDKKKGKISSINESEEIRKRDVLFLVKIIYHMIVVVVLV